MKVMFKKRIMIRWITYLFVIVIFSSCNTSRSLIDLPSVVVPDYSKESFWGALPEKTDVTDKTPKGMTAPDKIPDADVFFFIQLPTPVNKKSLIGMEILQMINCVLKQNLPRCNFKLLYLTQQGMFMLHFTDKPT